MIRIAEMRDVPELLRMGKRFHEVSGYSEFVSYDPETVTQMFKTLIENKTLLTDGKNTMLGFVVFPFFFNKNILTAQELFWWVDKDKRKTGIGVEILRSAEKQANLLGAKSLIMLNIKNLDGDSVGRLYKSLGYKETEQTYMRSL